MQLNKILKISLVAVCLFFLMFQALENDLYAACTRAFLVVLFTVLYSIEVKQKRMFFYLFLLCFCLAEIINFTSRLVTINGSNNIDYFYYAANGLYILSYIFLILRVIKDMNLKVVLSKFWIHLVILIVLDVFCVMIVSGTTKKVLSVSQYSLELTYNAVIMVLLTVAMLNYMYMNTQKSMNLLLGAIFIFFSEVIQLTYFYISDIKMLNVLCSLFLVFAFLFFYLQAISISEEDHSSSSSLNQNATV